MLKVRFGALWKWHFALRKVPLLRCRSGTLARLKRHFGNTLLFCFANVCNQILKIA